MLRHVIVMCRDTTGAAAVFNAKIERSEKDIKDMRHLNAAVIQAQKAGYCTPFLPFDAEYDSEALTNMQEYIEKSKQVFLESLPKDKDRIYKMHWVKHYTRSGEILVQAKSEDEAYEKLDKEIGDLHGSLNYDPDQNEMEILGIES